MKTYKVDHDPQAVASKILYLAWRASGVSGMGWMQARNAPQLEQQIWDSAVNADDYPFRHEIDKPKPGAVYADYVQGRMMKLSIKWTADSVTITDNYRHDYQSFCGKYPNADALFAAALCECRVPAKV